MIDTLCVISRTGHWAHTAMVESTASVRIVLPFNYVGRNEFQYEVISAFVQHILYARTLLPVPLNDFRQDVFRLTTATKISSNDRKKVKTLAQIEEVLSGLLAAVQVFDVATVAILLGPSANNPKEVYQLRFEFSPNYPEVSAVDLTDRHVNHAKRNLIHKLIEYQATDDTAPISRQNMFVAFQINEDSHPQGTDSTHTHTQPVEDDVLHQDVFSTFSFRDTFRIREATPVGSRSSVGGKKRMKPLHLHLVSKDVAQSIDGVAAAMHSVSVQHSGTVRDFSSGTNVTSGDTAAMHTDEAGEVPAQGMEQSATRWLVQNRGLKGLPSLH